MSDPLNLLIIEDSEDDALLVLLELRRGGFDPTWQRVETAEDLRDALAANAWDIVISDYRLPGFEAPAALAIVQQSQLDIPFVVVSGTIGELAAVELMKTGAHDYLMKDNLVRLSEVVRRGMREFQIRAERAQAAIALTEAKDRLHLAIEGSNIGLWDWSIPTSIVTFNDRWAEMIGYSLEELGPTTIETWQTNVHPDDLSTALRLLEQHFAQEIPTYECELRMRHRLGHWVWVLARGTVVERASDGTPLRMTGTHLDISERKQAELQLSLQNAILERIAKAEPLTDILEALVQASEEQLEGGLCSILLHREGRLYYGAAPHLPAAYSQAIDGMTVDEGAGSCGTAVVRRQPVIVADIATDPLWQHYKDFALPHGLRACWSVPVIASDGSVLATFAVYHSTIHHPKARELAVIAIVANVTKIAIERERNTQALEQLNRELEDRVAQRTLALQRSEASLREAQQVARLGSWELDAATEQIAWSSEIFSIFRLDPQQPAPSYDSLFRYFPAKDGAHLKRLLERALHQGEPYTADFQIIRADGSSGYIFVKAEVNLGGDGRVNRVFGIAMDISDQKTLQAALQRSEARAQATLLALPDLVFRVNHAGEYVDFMVSPPGRNLLNPEEVIGKTVDEVFPSHLVVTNGVTKFGTIQKALETQSVQSYEQQVWIDGSLHYEEVRIAPCGEDEVVLFVRDISDRKQAEAQLQQTNAELAQATRLKDEFLANMSHELRTPLTSILGMTDVLKEEIFGELNDKQQQYLEVVAQSGRHLLSLINDILDLAKIESGKLELQRSPILIPVLCGASISFVKQLAYQKNIKLTSYLPDEDIGAIYVDELRMKQALINLLSNAVKFTPPDGRVTLEVTCDRTQSLLQFHVIDTGIGIAAEDMPKLFQSFMQIDSRLNRQYNGTGLGLSLVKRIVELHQGSITVDSTPGRGSRFTITLPNCLVAHPRSPQFQPSPEPPPSAQDTQPKASALILLAEDNSANIDTFSAYLTSYGYRLIVATNGLEVPTLAQKYRPDLILMDIQMPGMDGLSVTRHLRTQPDTAHIPIIALTALAMASDRDRCLAAGANAYFAKPVKLKQLVLAIQAMLKAPAP